MAYRFQQPYSTIVQQRRSYRTYDATPLNQEVKSKLYQALETLPAPPGKSTVSIDLLTDFDARRQGVTKLGTYGRPTWRLDFPRPPNAAFAQAQRVRLFLSLEIETLTSTGPSARGLGQRLETRTIYYF